jgi:hypothetical protein
MCGWGGGGGGGVRWGNVQGTYMASTATAALQVLRYSARLTAHVRVTLVPAWCLVAGAAHLKPSPGLHRGLGQDSHMTHSKWRKCACTHNSASQEGR